MIYRVHAAVSIRRMYVMKILIASTNSLHWFKNTEQTARKFAGVNEPLQRTLGTLGVRPLPTPHPLGVPFSMKLKFVKTVQTQTIWVQWLLSSKCNDRWNLFLIKLMLFQSVFLVSCFLSAKKIGAWLYSLLFCLFPDIDECSSGTHDCHSSRATCTNTVGSFNCSCNSSYIGDGRTCNISSGNRVKIMRII